MVHTQKDGGDFIKDKELESLGRAINRYYVYDYEGGFWHMSNWLAENTVEKIFPFIDGGKYVCDGEDLGKGEEELLNILYGIKSSEGNTPIEKIQNYRNQLISDIIEDEKKRLKEEGESEDEKTTEKRIKEEIEDLDRTRANQGNARIVESQSFEDALEEAIHFLTNKSKEKERKRQYNKELSQMHQMNKTQAMFGEKLLLYRAVKKRLKVKTRARKENAIYVSMDNSGSMAERDRPKKAKDFIARLYKSGHRIMYTSWNSDLNGPFEKINGSFRFDPDGEDSLFHCSKRSIEETEEGASLVMITDGTTYLELEETELLFKLAEKKNIHLILVSFGKKDNYDIPEDKKDRLIAY